MPTIGEAAAVGEATAAAVIGGATGWTAGAAGVVLVACGVLVGVAAAPDVSVEDGCCGDCTPTLMMIWPGACVAGCVGDDGAV